MTRIFNTDQGDGITRIFHHDESTGLSTIETQQDVTALVELNKAEFSMYDERTPMGGDGLVRVASIPNCILAGLQRRGITDDKDKFMAWLNAPENRFFRTRPGTV
jgi:hypothetical protein